MTRTVGHLHLSKQLWMTIALAMAIGMLGGAFAWWRWGAFIALDLSARFCL
jgi:hypothetical protein